MYIYIYIYIYREIVKEMVVTDVVHIRVDTGHRARLLEKD